MVSTQFISVTSPDLFAGPVNAPVAKSVYTVMNGHLIDPASGRRIPLKKLALWREDPVHVDFELSTIDLALLDENADLALKLIEEALQHDPRDAYTLINKARAFALQGNYQAAAEVNRQALEIEPNDSSALHNRAIDLQYTGDYAQALKLMDKAIMADPTYAPSILHKGEILLAMGKKAEAFAAFEQALKTESFGVLNPFRQEYVAEQLGCKNRSEALEMVTRRKAEIAAGEPSPQPA